MSYYKRKKIELKRKKEEKELLEKVKSYRKRQPLVGVRKLQKMLSNNGIKVGRDRLFRILRKQGLLVKRKKKYIKTTNSQHRFRVHKNIIKGIKLNRPNHVYVADITYIRTKEGFSYLSLLTDKYSRKIVGYNLSRSLGVEGCLKALKMAIKELKGRKEIIHHSDRGLQYCTNIYTNMLRKNNIRISMTEENHIYENSLAERVNGILKNELLLGTEYLTYTEAKVMIKEAVDIYNNERLHLSLNYITPAVLHAA